MLVYSGGDLNPIGYTDSDFQSDRDSRKSTSGSVFTLGGGAIVWRRIKQSSIMDSVGCGKIFCDPDPIGKTKLAEA